MAACVPLQDWLKPAPVMRQHEKVRRVPDMVPGQVCDWLISRARGRLQRAVVYDSVARGNMVHEMRTNTMASFDLATLDVVQLLLQERMARTCSYPLQQLETPMVLHDSIGQQITPHFDFIDAQADLSPDRRMLHTGSPPTAGEKWIVTQFLVSKQLRP